ncbi:MAG: hypothetical protein O2780_00470 [Proteobacteria bacterium]|nr:hypothetical protein [Pseudomonadota bacterium]
MVEVLSVVEEWIGINSVRLIEHGISPELPADGKRTDRQAFHGSSGRTLCRPENFPARQRRARPGHAEGSQVDSMARLKPIAMEETSTNKNGKSKLFPFSEPVIFLVVSCCFCAI